MQLRFHEARNGAEQIFHGCTEPHHAVCLQLAHIHDRVRLQERGDHRKRAAQPCLRRFQLAPSAIKVQLCPVFCRRGTAGALVNALQQNRCVRSAGAFRDDNGSAQFPEQGNDGTDHNRVRYGAFLRRRPHDEIRFDRHAHAGADHLLRLEKAKLLRKRCAHGVIFIRFTGGDAHFHWLIHARSSSRKCSIRCSASVMWRME